jgi:signal transduction histidine kinase
MCLINLILNSAQAIEESGSIGVDFRGNGEIAFISVTDNGKGLETEEIQRIFEPYYSTKKLGIGIGLSITKRLVEEHGGAIAVESSVNGKTVITIQVPNHAV